MYGVCGNDHVVIVTRNFTKRALRSLAPFATDRFIPVLCSFHPPLSSSLFPALPLRRSIDAPFRSPRPMRPISTPRAVMHYETRNDESAYVSHVMEIPLLIRALNDSATAGYIMCIITLATARGIRWKTCPPPPSLWRSFLFLFAGSDASVIIDRQKAIGEGPDLVRSGSARRVGRRYGNDLYSGL